jgi:hypothetical protein
MPTYQNGTYAQQNQAMPYGFAVPHQQQFTGIQGNVINQQK